MGMEKFTSLFIAVNKWLAGLPDNSPIILGIVCTALLTILIPMSIAAFREGKKDEDFFDLDRAVALYEIFQGTSFGVPNLIYYVGLVFVPLMLWSVFPPIIMLAF